ncbi:MAG: Rid family detoxifying hydrolase [Bacteroidia bacterium]|jgi:2-iminobutanoate/2-iminopropanoate deaminase|nr:Rid family detoxifying hydrolase [Bacteroidia bacterium]MDG1747627.1 Rid family detoxifying hydrolase [Bacteroidia bacterium]
MRHTIYSKEAPEPIGPYTQAVQYGNTIFLSGQIGIDRTGEFVSEDVVQQTNQVMKNIGFVLKEAGLSYENIIKTSIFLKDMNDFPKVNDAYASYFQDQFPARETVEVSRLPKDAKVEISVVVGK